MDFTWADDAFMRQAAATVLGATLTALFAALSFIFTTIRAGRHRRQDAEREKIAERSAWVNQRFADFEEQLADFDPIATAWLNEQVKFLSSPVTDLESLRLFAERSEIGGTVRIPLSLMKQLNGEGGEADGDEQVDGADGGGRLSPGTPTFNKIIRALSVLLVKSPNEEMRERVRRAQKKVNMHHGNLVILEIANGSLNDLDEKERAEVQELLNEASEALKAISGAHSAWVDSMAKEEPMRKGLRLGRRQWS